LLIATAVKISIPTSLFCIYIMPFPVAQVTVSDGRMVSEEGMWKKAVMGQF
jgi:hypothetical protein